MRKKSNTAMIPAERIEQSIWLIRGHKVMLDSDLAVLYGVPTHRLNEAVKRNIERFPDDFMFQLTKQEAENLISQIAISSLENNRNQKDENLKFQIGTSSLEVINNHEVGSLRGQIGTSKQHGGTRKLPYVFTEQGVAMLSSVLRSSRAVQVNIAIMRAFVKMRELMLSQEAVRREVQALKRKYKDHDEKINAIFLMIDEIIAQPVKETKKRRIGFMREDEE